MRNVLVLVSCLSAFTLFACTPRDESVTTKPPIDLSNGPLMVSLKQRSDAEIPGSGGEIALRIGDITRGEVLTSIVELPAGGILSQKTLREGDSLAFNFAEIAYEAKLCELHNSLMGEDSASYVIDTSETHLPSEKEKIETLIDSISKLENAKFIRNGKEYNSEDAANHLLRKWKAAGNRVQTARDFIAGVGTHSSISSAPYRIKFEDGRDVLTSDYLLQRLGELE